MLVDERQSMVKQLSETRLSVKSMKSTNGVKGKKTLVDERQSMRRRPMEFEI